MPFDAIDYQGRNFAPTKPLREAKALAKKDPKENDSSINAFFRELWQGLSEENETAWRECIKQGEIISNLRSGKLSMKSDLSGTGYVFLRPLSSGGGRDRSNYPLFPQNSEILTAKWQRARPVVRARNFGDGYKTEIVLNQVDTVIKSYFRDMFTSVYETREAYSAQDYGTYITQFEYDDKYNQMVKIVPIIQNESKVLVDGYGACYDCQFEGHPSDFEKTGAPYPQCPECNSFRTTEMVPDAVADEAVITDLEPVSQGDLKCKLIDFPACRYDPRVFAHESDWFLYSERVPVRLTDRLFGEGLEIDRGDVDDIGLQVMDSLAHRGGNVAGHGQDGIFGTYERFNQEGVLRNMYLKPAMYEGFKLKKSESTLAGRIPADVPFEEIFPDGLCVRGFNEMKTLVGLHAQKPNLASGVYLYQSHSGIGKSVSDAVDSAKDLNEVYSMAMAGVKRLGASGVAVDKDAGLTQEDVRNLFKPQKAVFVDTTNNGGDINKSVMQIKANPINPVLPQMMIQLANMINLAFMTGDFTQGTVQDVDINTFGGQQLAHAKAEEQKGAILTRKTFHRELSAEIIFDLFRRHIKMPKYYAHDQHGETRGKWISGADMPEKIKFDAVPESEIPENKYEKRLAKQEMVEKAGGIAQFAQAIQIDPKTTQWFAEGFGQELPMLSQEKIQLVCLERVAQIQELANLYPDPEQILASLTNKLRVREEAHLFKSEFLQKILDDDEVQTWSPVAFAALELLIERHYELEAESQVRNEMIAMQAQNLLAQKQQEANRAMMQPEVDAQNAAMEQEAVAGAVQEVAGRVLDDEQAQVDHERQEEAKDNDEARSERAAERQHMRSVDMEKTKAKLQPKPAPAKAAAKRK